MEKRFLTDDDLSGAINLALDQAKESGEFNGADGADGASITITNIDQTSESGGVNVVTFSDGTNLLVQNGYDGDEGRGITSIVRTSGTGAAGTTDTYTITYTDGETSVFTVYNGKNGTNGTNGENGASVTVSKVTESSASGGTNVVAFSDGSTLNVKNGKDGADGADGDDYVLTASDKNEIVAEAAHMIDISRLDDAVLFTEQTLTEAQKAQARANIGATAGEDVEFADSVDWLNEYGDTAKKYVLPDGFIYQWMAKTETVLHDAHENSREYSRYNNRPTPNASMDSNTANAGYYSLPPIEIDNTWSDCIVNISGLEKLVENFYSTFYVFFYKADGSWLGYHYAGQYGFSDTEQALPISVNIKYSKDLQYWNQAKYVRIALAIKSSGSLNYEDADGLVINFERLNTTKTETGWYSTGQQHSNDKVTQQNAADIATLKEEVETLKEAAQKSPTQSGAVWYALGDSITYGTRGEPPTQTLAPVVGQRWVDYVAKYNGYELTNLGVSGSGFVTGTTLRTVIDGNDFTSVDIVTLMMGINDWKNTEAVNKVGTMDDAVGETYTDKIIPEMRYAFEKILSENPYCKIFFITPINARVPYNNATEATNWSYGYTGSGFVCGNLISFIEKLKEVCEYYNVQIIDMTKGSVVNRKNINTMLPDGLHPCLDGYKALGTELARRITFA